VEWLLGILSCIFLILSLADLYKKCNIITHYSPEFSSTHPSLPFSIVLCTEGEAAHLLSYLDKILSQNYSSYEVIVICKNTPPKVYERLTALVNDYTNLHIENISNLELPYTEKKQALNYGIALAKYNWIVTIDDDCYPSSADWLASISKHILHFQSDILLGLSPYISHPGVLNHWIRYDALYTAINQIYYTLINKPYMGIGRNMAFKKGLWTKEYLDLYSTLGSGDDTTLVNFYRSKKRIDVFIEPATYSFPKNSFIAWVKQKLRHINKGSFIEPSIQLALAKPLLYNFLFWFCTWIWISFFAFHFLIFGIIFIFIFFKTLFLIKISRHICWKLKPIFYTILFDTLHSFCLLIFPFLSIFIKFKWRKN
jgi:glycosyltransferase involved in cell wall biosynthesis